MRFKSDTPITVIGPGEYYVATRPLVIKTLLGSCVAACVYDEVNRVQGMNHFLLPNDKMNRVSQAGERAGYYGVFAMKLLIESLLNKGAEKKHLRSKIFGGASVLAHVHGRSLNFYDVGQVNVLFALESLKSEQIPLVSQDTGGNLGRVIYFDGRDFAVYRHFIDYRVEQRLRTQAILGQIANGQGGSKSD